MKLKDAALLGLGTFAAQSVVQRTWHYFDADSADWSTAGSLQALIVAVLMTIVYATWDLPKRQ